MDDIQIQLKPFHPFMILGLTRELPPIQDDRDLWEPFDRGPVERFWNGMLESSFLGITDGDVARTQEGGCAIAWIPRQHPDEKRFEVVGGAYPWTAIRSVLDGTWEGTVTFHSYLRQGLRLIPEALEGEALRLFNRWNASTRCWPRAILFGSADRQGAPGIEILLTSDMRICDGTFQAQVDRFIDDSMKGADTFWNWFLTEWGVSGGIVQ